MFRFVTLLVTSFLTVSYVHAFPQDDDPIAAKIAKARLTYEEWTEEADSAFVESMKARLEKLKTELQKKPDSTSIKVKDLKTIESERKSFENVGKTPVNRFVEEERKAYLVAIEKAKAGLKSALEMARADYLKADKFDDAEEIESEIETLKPKQEKSPGLTKADKSEMAADPIAGFWRIAVGEGQGQTSMNMYFPKYDSTAERRLLANSNIRNRIKYSLGKWTRIGRTYTVHWIGPRGKLVTAQVNVSADGQKLTGTTARNAKVNGIKQHHN